MLLLTNVSRSLRIATLMGGMVVMGHAAHADHLPGPGAANWTGFYLGLHGGYAWSEVSETSTNTNFWNAGGAVPLGTPFVSDTDGAIFGGQIGYNHQVSNWVMGVEATYSGGGLRETGAISPFFPTMDVYGAKISDIITVTGRLGYATGHSLVYVKGGYASAEVETRHAFLPVLGVESLSSGRHDGWTLGAGVETKLSANWSLALDYSYINLDDASRSAGITFGGVVFSTITSRVDPEDIHAVTVRINVRLDREEPVAAPLK